MGLKNNCAKSGLTAALPVFAFVLEASCEADHGLIPSCAHLTATEAHQPLMTVAPAPIWRLLGPFVALPVVMSRNDISRKCGEERLLNRLHQILLQASASVPQEHFDSMDASPLILPQQVDGLLGTGVLDPFSGQACGASALQSTQTIPCPKSMVGRVIGKGGETIKALQQFTGAMIQIDQSQDPTRVTVAGDSYSVKMASSMCR